MNGSEKSVEESKKVPETDAVSCLSELGHNCIRPMRPNARYIERCHDPLRFAQVVPFHANDFRHGKSRPISSATRLRVSSSRVRFPSTEQNCFGRSLPVIFLVRGLRRVPSPPAKMTAHSLPRPVKSSFDGEIKFRRLLVHSCILIVVFFLVFGG